MINESLKKLSDVELHHQLVQYGFPSVPVTETTRNVLLRRLKNHITTTRNINKSPAKFTGITQKYIFPESNTPTYTNQLNKNFSNIYNSTSRNSIIASQPCTIESFAEKYNLTQKLYPPPENPKNKGKNCSCSASKIAASDQHIGVVNRLLNLRGKTISKSSPFTAFNSEDESEMPNPNIIKRNIKPASVVAKYTIKQFKRPTFSIQTLIPYVLISAFITFIVSLAFLYIKISFGVGNAVEITSTKFALCGEAYLPEPTADGYLNCIERDRLNMAIELVGDLKQVLYSRVENICFDKSKSSALSFFEFIDHLQRNKTMSKEHILHSIEDIKYLIKHNPNWKIDFTHIEDLSAIAEDPNRNRASTENAFILYNTNLSLTCILYNKMQKFFSIIGLGIIIVALFKGCSVCYKSILTWHTNRTTQVENFTKDIINEVIQRASFSDDPKEKEAILNHLRDKLVPLNKRKQLMWAWEQALHLLEKNDSRVMFGMTIQNGHEFRTIKWIGNMLNNSQEQVFSKQWQSPAFNNSNNIINPPTPCLKIRHMFDYSEIGHPNFKQIISKAIFDKVGSKCKILEIQIDLKSCCVYIRCASEADAGIVHSEINGWWFDKRLISIKFLRLQRYLTRFPNTKKENSFTSDCYSIYNTSVTDDVSQ